MSGGVDSSVAALLLKDKGYDVTGVTFWLWDYEGSPEYRGEENECCSLDIAKVAAEQIGIPHVQIDVSEKFKEEVIENTKNLYLRGLTPNPCARCNRFVRFGYALKKARDMGFEKISTGHHARIKKDEGGYKLLRGKDPVKDQSYFLYSLRQEELSKAIFPVGKYDKEEIYEIAEENDLISAQREESQDLCFVTEDDYRDFLKRELGDKIRPGKIINIEGEVIGEHEGIPFYTIGQRKGLGLETNVARYVVDIDPEENIIIVGSKKDLFSKGLVAKNCSWTRKDYPGKNHYQVKIRYRNPAMPAEVQTDGEDRAKVIFDEPKKSVAPGQIAAFYNGEELIGGGVIEKRIE